MVRVNKGRSHLAEARLLLEVRVVRVPGDSGGGKVVAVIRHVSGMVMEAKDALVVPEIGLLLSDGVWEF